MPRIGKDISIYFQQDQNSNNLLAFQRSEANNKYGKIVYLEQILCLMNEVAFWRKILAIIPNREYNT